MSKEKLFKLHDLYSNGQISRREFLTRASALGLTAALSPSLFAVNPAKASTPQKGGRLRIGMMGGSASDTLDPATIVDALLFSVNFQIRNCLVEIDHNFKPVPELAEAWEASPDAKKWMFKLRKGVEFHNGKTMDANDVIYSINYHRREDSKSSAKPLVSQITEIKAGDKYEVEFILENGNADFPALLADYHLPIIPDQTTDFGKGVGTGGYILESFEPGVKIVTKRNPNYWKTGRAHFDEVETLNIADSSSRMTALKTGRVDVINHVDRKTAHLLKKTPGIQLIVTPGLEMATFPMRCDIPPFDNNDARMAMKHAIDRNSMVKTILRGYGSLGNDHPIAPIMRYCALELPQREYDPDKAKYYIKKAGLEGQVFKLHAADTAFNGAVDASVLYKEHAAKAGIKIDVMKEPNDGYWSNIWAKKPLCAGRWNGRPTEDWMFTIALEENAAWNETHFKHQRFNKLLKEARAELNDSKRREMYFEMQKIVSDEGGMIVPMFTNYVEAASTKLKFDNVSGLFDLDGCRLAERWWFES